MSDKWVFLPSLSNPEAPSVAALAEAVDLTPYIYDARDVEIYYHFEDDAWEKVAALPPGTVLPVTDRAGNEVGTATLRESVPAESKVRVCVDVSTLEPDSTVPNDPESV